MHAALQEQLSRRAVMLDRIRTLLIDQLRVQREADEIDPDTPLFGGGLALDSIDAVDLLVHLGADFGVDIASDEEGRTALRTVNAVVDLALAAEEAARANE
ncbi:MAG TPA: phosphopantetheine-binding protein [Longimicrobiales bacterium]|nr:phosphopantetheine-binding protein [Longimicrobiales bacterium]